MVISIIRTVILFAAVVISLRIMGKRQVSQLQPYELVIVIMLSALAAIPMQNTGVPLASGLFPIVTLLVVQVLLSFIAMKSERARGVICGTPSILVRNGHIEERELYRLRYNVNDLLEQLRSKNVPNISDVEFAILETSGELSVLLKSQKRPVVPADMNLPTVYEGLPVTLVVDGRILDKNLTRVNLSVGWLRSELKKFGVTDLGDVFFASLDTEGKLFFQRKSRPERKAI